MQEKELSYSRKYSQRWRNKLNLYAFAVTVFGEGDTYPPGTYSGHFSVFQTVNAWRQTVRLIKEGKAPKQLGIFIFVPFCKTKCLFCPYYSFPVRYKSQLDIFTDSLIEEMRFFKGVFDGLKFNTLWFGGGTPSALEIEHFKKIFKTLNEIFSFTNDVQITMECAVSSLDYQKLKLFHSVGVNRVTVGIQSLNSRVLRKNNRLFQDKKRSLELIRDAKEIGIEIVNVDLMCGLPQDNIISFEKGLKEILALKPELIHINPFFPSAETNFFKKKYEYSGDDVQRRYAEARLGTQLIEKYGYRRADGAFLGFTRVPGVENQQEIDRIKYNSSFLGFGASVTSHAFANLQYSNVCFEKKWEKVTLPKYNGCKLNLKEEMRKHIIMNLRRPISRAHFRELFSSDILNIFSKEIQELDRHGLVLIDEERLIFKIRTRQEHVILAKHFFDPNYLNEIQEKIGLHFKKNKNYLKEVDKLIDKTV